MPTSVSLEELSSGTRILWFDSDAAVNTLDATAVAQFAQAVDSLVAEATERDFAAEQDAKKTIKGLIIASRQRDCFLAGADLQTLAANLDRSAEEITQRCEQMKRCFDRLWELPLPVIAAISGVCLGGGLELALRADDCVASTHPKTEIGLPEVRLGLLPGWGGCVLLPRKIGLGAAVKLISSGESLTATEAFDVGLVSAVSQPEKLIETAEALLAVRVEAGLATLETKRQRLRAPIDFADAELGLLSAAAHATLSKSLFSKAIAPRRAIDTTVEVARLPYEAASTRETEVLSELYGSAENRALLHVFFADQRLKKSHADQPTDAKSSLKRVGVIGAGIMGAGIAAANLKVGNQVDLVDKNDVALQHGMATAIELAAYDKTLKTTTKEKAIDAASRISGASNFAGLGEAELIVEAVVETMSVKQSLFAELETCCSEATILATNTSTLSITRIAESLQKPERFCGLHFFNPVHRMKLVEVIRGKSSSDATVHAVAEHVRRLGKKPIVVNDSPGFLVNRLLAPYLNEAAEMLREGASVKQIDAAARGFGMPMGPLQLYDMVGLDTAVKAGTTFWQAYPDRVKASPLLPRMVKLGRLGEKNGLGFYQHDPAKKRHPQADPAFAAIQAEYRYKVSDAKDFQHKDRQNAANFSAEQIVHRLLLPMLLEATRVLDEGIVVEPADVDVGVIYGLGFPAFKGGLLGWADQVGVKQLREWLQPWEALGARWQPTPRFLKMVEEDESFHSSGSFSL